MSNETIFYSSDLSNKSHIGLFDRIINIRFKRKNGEYFTIHSDYEPVWVNNSLYFKTCQPKPEIRVKYTQYQGTMINVDIFITNLNIKENLDADAKDAQVISSLSTISEDLKQGNTTNQPNDLLSEKGNTITEATIEMGYRGDFYNWSRFRDKYTGKDAEVYEAFQNLEGLENKAASLSETQMLFGKHRRCTVAIEWAVNINNPPDRVTQFHGYVGTTEAGFQPFASLAMDSLSKEKTFARITKEDLHKALNDPHDDIDEMSIQGVPNSLKGLLLSPKGTTYRNFFNGGRGFTLLEAICFNYVTRRFVRSNVNVKRNTILERVYLEYLEATEGSFSDSLVAYREAITQKLYAREQTFNTDYFIETDDGKLDFATSVSADIKKYFKETIDSLLADQIIGARYTIKNLPEYRRLYKVYRETIADEYKKGKYLPWWDVAEKISTKNLKNAYGANEVAELENTEDSLRGYLLDLQEGKLKDVDAYIKRTFFGDDWIIPVETIKSKIILKDNKGKKVTGKMPKNKTNDGFTDVGAEEPLPCFTGFFEVRDAYMFGVMILCTEKASYKVRDKLAEKTFINIPFLPQVQSQLACICKTFGLLMYKMNNGGYCIYDEKEEARDMSKQDFVRNQSSKPIRIPAIYDMTLSPTREMRMPFIGFLDPMTVVEWNSTSTIGSMVSYYYQPKKGKNYFLVISNEIDFSTTGDQNLMTIRLTDHEYVDASTVPASLTDKDKTEESKNVYSQVIIDITDDSQFDTWRKIYNSFLTVIPFVLLDKWNQTNTGRERTVDYSSFFLAMKAWNPELFALAAEKTTGGWEAEDGKKRVDKTADWLYGSDRTDKKTHFPEITYCFANTSIAANLKRIYMKYPIMPCTSDSAYNGDYSQMKEQNEERVLLYSQGEWSMELKSTVKKTFKIGNE